MNRLKAYRAIEELSQEQLSDVLGIAPQTVSAIESGRRPFNGDLSLLGYAPDRFDVPEMTEPLHRQRAATKISTQKRAKELLRLAGEVFAELRARTPGVPAVRLERLAPPTSHDQLDDLALEVRHALQVESTGPIRNLTAALERAGVCIVPIVGLDGVDGLSSWVEDTPVIGVSPTVPGDRFRLTEGHECGHLTFHAKPGATTEHEANRFASTLLMPQQAFEDAMTPNMQLRDFAALKSTWGISIAALVYRAHENGYIDDRRYRALQIQMSRWKHDEPGAFEPVPGQLFKRLVDTNGGIPGVAKALGVNRRHLVLLTRWKHLRVA